MHSAGAAGCSHRLEADFFFFFLLDLYLHVIKHYSKAERIHKMKTENENVSFKNRIVLATKIILYTHCFILILGLT